MRFERAGTCNKEVIFDTKAELGWRAQICDGIHKNAIMPDASEIE
jgi:hypothetical protein